jgi:hypothetical protein
MAKKKQTAWSGTVGGVKCNLPPKEALRRAMLVPVPDLWKKKSRGHKTAKPK